MKQPLINLVAAATALVAYGENPHRITPLANDYAVVSRSPAPKTTYCYTPGICRLPSGRLVVTCDWGGPDMKKVDLIGHVYLSDDHGKTWRARAGFPFLHARPFLADGKLYILGHRGRLCVVRSDDDGETWSAPSWLTDAAGGGWHQSACNVWYTRGNVYFVMEHSTPDPLKRSNGWGVNRLEPVLMRAKEKADLTQSASWTFAKSFCFTDIFDGDRNPQFPYMGIPWYKSFTEYPAGRLPKGKACGQPVGWLETNVVQMQDPDQEWYDPSGSTFHLFMRSNTAGSGYAVLAKVVEQADGSMQTMLEEAPSGVKTLFVPMPGGQMRFHVLWDEQTKLFWLLSTQTRNTMCRHDRMPKDRYNLPYDERQRLQLSFSRNMMDWVFAGLVAQGETTIESRHYAAMAIDGDDLCVVSRSGDKDAKSPHDTDMITFHRISDFRSLVY